MKTIGVILVLAIPALARGVSLAAQAVERTDVAGAGRIRVTFDPRILTWDSEFTDGGRLALGRGLSGDSVGGRYIPAVARLEQDLRVASGVSGFVASLGRGLLSVRQERRSLPVTAELGLTRHLAVSAMVPIVRVATRAHLELSPTGSNLGLNPRLTVSGANAQYQAFFTQFDAALTQLDANIGADMYGCPSSPQCAAASDSSAAWHAMRNSLNQAVYGVAQTGSPFMPLDSSDAGKAIATRLAAAQQKLDTAYGIVAFTDALLLPNDSLSAELVEAAIVDGAIGFGYRDAPFRNTWRLNVGDLELAAKYRVAAGAHYAAAAALLVRLPTGARDSADDLLRQSIGDHQMDLEGRLVQELTVGPLWLNVAVRAGKQRPGTRTRRVAPWDALLVPFAATTTTKGRDRYAFLSPQDSLDLAGRLGLPTPASVLDAGTSERRLRLGFAVTYLGPTVEGGFSIEQTVTGAGVAPAATVYRIVFRTSRKLF